MLWNTKIKMANKHKTIKKAHPHKQERHTIKRHTKHISKTQPRPQPKTTVIIIGGGVLLGFVFVMMNYSVMSLDKTYTTATKTSHTTISDEEKAQIKQWIINENRNSYGDRKGTIYIGGTPLFDESTGKYTDLYEYILQTHPDRPWK
jgi:uncharacterized membrane protein YvbJ